MKNQNLIPTPIVDKNGVSSTRLKRQDARKSSAALDWLNPVAAIRRGSECRKLAAATQELLTRDDDRHPYSLRNDELSDAFKKSSDLVFMKNAFVAAEMVTRKEADPEIFQKDRTELIRLLSLHGEHGIDVTDKINAVAAHREWITADVKEDRFNIFTSTMSLVMDKHFPDSVQEDGSVRNIEAHCVAYSHFLKHTNRGYVTDVLAMKAVDSHPDQVESVLKFIDERGSEPFSDEAFVEYQRIQPAMSDGWL